MEILSLADGVTARYYSFSEHVVCVEVNKNGKHMGSFCSDVSQFEEWEKDEIISLVQQHIKLVEFSSSLPKGNNYPLFDDLELQYSKHTEDLYCIEVYKAGKVISTFCADGESFDEWMEDKEQLMQVVRNFIS